MTVWMKIKNWNLRLMAVACLGSGLLSIFLGQDRNWDLRNYHVYNAYSFLNDRLTFDIAPAQIQSFHNPLLDVPFYLALTHVIPIVYGFLVGFLQGFNFWLIYRISCSILTNFSRSRRRILSFFAATAGYVGAVNISEIGTTFFDNITSLFVLSAVLIVISSRKNSDDEPASLVRIPLLVAGFLLGCGSGLKLPSTVFAVAFFMTIPITNESWKARLSSVVNSGVGICCGVLATMGFWMAILWRNFENPVFPYFNRIFQSPFYSFTNFRDERFLPTGVLETLFYPFHFFRNPLLVCEIPFRDLRFALCYLLLVVFFVVIVLRYLLNVLKGKNRDESRSLADRNVTFLILFFVVSYAVWQTMFSIYRYIVPLEFLAPVFIFVVIRAIFSRQMFVFQASLLLCVVIVLFVAPMDWGREAWTDSFFDVKVPNVVNLDSSTVIIADEQPLSYVVPFFPKSTRFVSVNNNFMRPGLTNGLQDLVRDTLRTCGDDILLLYSEKSYKDYQSILGFYNLRIDGEIKAFLSTKLDDHLYLVSVSRTR